MYVVDRDFGFAPNPFHGFCTLATCKSAIRSTAGVGDWIIGMGGRRLNATGRCIFAMRVTEKITFDEYWTNPAYLDKKPIRNGSKKMMVGDNIYHQDAKGHWHQADSHHSKMDGGVNPVNVLKDTKSDKVLISRHFYYFGVGAPLVPADIVSIIGFTNRVGHRVFRNGECAGLIEWLYANFGKTLNTIHADPFYFSISHKRYSAENNKIS